MFAWCLCSPMAFVGLQPKKFNARDVAGELDRIHPYSRKASQLRRSQLRSNKIANTKQTYQSHDVECTCTLERNSGLTPQ